jgi:hypothetical protein
MLTASDRPYDHRALVDEAGEQAANKSRLGVNHFLRGSAAGEEICRFQIAVKA